MQLINHRLHKDDGTPYPFTATPNFDNKKLKAKYLVMHYTAGSSAQSAVEWLCNPVALASAHLVIGRDGGVTQLADFDRVTWHAGPSQWEGLVDMNRHSIGIELDNAGRLVREGNRWMIWSKTKEYSGDEVMEAVHKNEGSMRGWHTYTAEQLEVALEVALLLVREYKLLDVIGHDDISPRRKWDPGPAFPMESFRGRVVGRQQSKPALLIVATDFLNIRTGPGPQHPTIPGGPLTKGVHVEVIKIEQNWRYVRVHDVVNSINDLEGWVSGFHLERE
ncbi:MAG: N-acetylmuramoyl-L-alanine amidase [Anaerolineales bacterium]